MYQLSLCIVHRVQTLFIFRYLAAAVTTQKQLRLKITYYPFIAMCHTLLLAYNVPKVNSLTSHSVRK